MTDDHQWMVAGLHNMIQVFTFNESLNEFTLNETIDNISGVVRHISLTNDHSFMAVSTESDYVYIYNHNGSVFVQKQRLRENSKNGERAFLSDDHQNLLVSADKEDWLFGDYCYVYSYRYNSTSGKFYKKTTYTFRNTYSNYVSISTDEYFMAFSGNNETMV